MIMGYGNGLAKMIVDGQEQNVVLEIVLFVQKLA